MGIFDPPAVGIRKRIPSGALADFDSLVAQTANAASSYVSPSKQGVVIGFIASAWALSQFRTGAMDLSAKDATYISNTGATCSKMLGRDQAMAISMLGHLVEQGVIVEPD